MFVCAYTQGENCRTFSPQCPEKKLLAVPSHAAFIDPAASVQTEERFDGADLKDSL